MTSISDLKVKIFADGADRRGMLDLYQNCLIKGFTTNPTLMRRPASRNMRRLHTTSSRRFPTVRSRSRSFPTTSPRWTPRRAGSRRGVIMFM